MNGARSGASRLSRWSLGLDGLIVVVLIFALITANQFAAATALIVALGRFVVELASSFAPRRPLTESDYRAVVAANQSLSVVDEKLRADKARVDQAVVDQTHEIKAGRARLLASINSLQQGLIITDANLSVIAANTAALRLICGESGILPAAGATSQNYLSGCTLSGIEKALGGDFRLRDECRRSLDQRQHREFQTLPFHDRFINLYISPIILANEALGVALVVEDVTEARVLARSKDEFFSIASHELRTPLTAIRGNAAMLRDQYAPILMDANAREMVADILSASTRLIAIVNDFLDTSRLEQGRVVFHPTMFDVDSVVNESLAELRPIADDKRLALTANAATIDNPPVWADRDRTKQVLVNLVGNAIKFTSTGGVGVTFGVNQGMMEVAVTDTGQGIAPQFQPLLFRKFQQAGDSLLTRDSTTGTGLGLYISQHMVEGMGGQLWLAASGENRGATFAFTLPLAPSASVATLTPPAAQG